jgi:hypothetical protein
MFEEQKRKAAAIVARGGIVGIFALLFVVFVLPFALLFIAGWNFARGAAIADISGLVWWAITIEQVVLVSIGVLLCCFIITGIIGVPMILSAWVGGDLLKLGITYAIAGSGGMAAVAFFLGTVFLGSPLGLWLFRLLWK